MQEVEFLGEKTRLRQCIVSRRRVAPDCLYRFVLVDKEITYDAKQVLPGRGAYLFPENQVLEKARELKFWLRAFRVENSNEINYAKLTTLLERLKQKL